MMGIRWVDLVIAIGVGLPPRLRKDVSILLISRYFLLGIIGFLENFALKASNDVRPQHDENRRGVAAQGTASDG